MRHSSITFIVESKRQAPGYSFATDCYGECQLIYVTEGQLLLHGEAAGNEITLDPHGVVLLRPVGADGLGLRLHARSQRGPTTAD